MLLRHRTTGHELKAELNGDKFLLESGEHVSGRVLLQTYDVASASVFERMELRSELSEAAPEYHRPPGPRGMSGALAGPGCAVMLAWKGLQAFLVLSAGLVPFILLLDWIGTVTFPHVFGQTVDWTVLFASPILLALAALLRVIEEGVRRFPTGYFLVRRRAVNAMGVRERLLAGKPPEEPFALYLRSFLTSGRLTRDNEGRLEEFETCLTEALELAWNLPLVSIGNAGDNFGSGRIPVETAAWQGFVRQAIGYADVVFIVPGNTEGTLWELECLAEQNAVSKTIVIMPPSSQSFDIKTWWEDVRVVSRRLMLPPYVAGGRFLRFGKSGRVSTSSAIPSEWAVFEMQESLRVFLGPGIP